MRKKPKIVLKAAKENLEMRAS